MSTPDDVDTQVGDASDIPVPTPPETLPNIDTPPQPPTAADTAVANKRGSFLLNEDATSNSITTVWTVSPKEVWRKATVLRSSGTILTIHNDAGTEIEVPLTECHVFDPSHDLNLDDISRLNNLHEAPLLHVLKRRFGNNQIYTYCGHVLISLNPYQVFKGLYDLEKGGREETNGKPPALAHTTSESPDKEPHVFDIAQNAFTEMSNPHNAHHPNQSVVVSGESGAGKTEASKHVMRYLLHASQCSDKDKESGERIQQRLLDSNVVLEAFGNAKTVRNDNSSRFGKYIKMKYDDSLTIIGAKTDTFLLEKSRLIHVDDGERNYHVFYQMCAGHSSRSVLPATEYKLLSQGNTIKVNEGVDDKEEFMLTKQALNTMGVSEDDQLRIFDLLLGLLQLGNATSTMGEDEKATVDFAPPPTVGGAPTPPVSLATIAALFGVDPTLLKNAIVIRMQTSGRGSTTSIPLTPDQALNNIHALIKYAYGATFSYLVSAINAAHAIPSSTATTFIGILDIFGFEIMRTNSFEQLCINFANEMLQQQFNQQVFVLEKVRYEDEGLTTDTIEFQDNQLVIDLISKKPTGLFITLEEHGMMNRKPDNSALLTNYHKNHDQHPNYAKPRFKGDNFIVKHFAGDVTYDITSFIEKNNDSLNEQLVLLMKSSSVKLIQDTFELATEEPAKEEPKDAGGRARNTVTARGGKMAQKVTVSSIFRVGLEALVTQLAQTNPHYIKCIKPNAVKLPGGFSNTMVCEQLRYSGTLEVVRIRRQGYPVRMHFKQFSKQFEILRYGQPEDIDPKDACVFIGGKYLVVADGQQPKFQIGKTKIFLRDGVLEELAYDIKMFYHHKVARIQSRFRGNKDKAEYKKTRVKVAMLQSLCRMIGPKKDLKVKKEKIAVMQTVVRGKMGRKMFLIRKTQILQERKETAGSTLLQKIVRARLAKKEVGARIQVKKEGEGSELIQRMFRGKKARKQVAGIKQTIKENDNSLKIQAVFRARKGRQRVVGIRSAIMLQSKLRMLRARIEYRKVGEANLLLQKRSRIMGAKRELGKRKQEKKEGEAAVLMGSMVRMRAEKKKFRKERSAIIALQCASRCLKARSTLFSEKTKARLARQALEKKSANLMQGGWKIVKAKEERYRRKDARDFKMACFMQSGVRRWRKRTEFVKYKRTVVSLQQCQRSKQAKEALSKHKGAREIQTRFRERAARREYESDRAAILKVQTIHRGRTEKKEFEKALNATVMLQKRARVGNAKREYEKDRAAILKVQTMHRGRTEKREFGKAVDATVMLQKRARVGNAKRAYEKDRADITKGQSMVRMALQRRDFSKSIRLTKSLQKAVRTLLRNIRLQDALLKVHKAAKIGKVDELVLLLDKYKEFDLRHIRNRYDSGKSLLHSAAISNSVDVVALLCSDPEDVFMADTHGNTPFHIAAKHSSASVMKFFTDTALNAVFTIGDSDSMRERMLSDDSDDSGDGRSNSKWEERPPVREGILKMKNWVRGWVGHYAVLRQDKIEWYRRKGDMEPLKEVSLKDATVQRSGEDKYTWELYSPDLLDKKNKDGNVFFQCLNEQDLQMWLVDLRRTDVNTETRKAGKTHVRSFLNLEKRAEICRLKNDMGETALHIICQAPMKTGSVSIEIALWLAENGNEMNEQNIEGQTPLHLAIREGNIDMAASLVRKGGDMMLKNKEGLSALDIIENPMDVQKVCMVANIGGSNRNKLLGDVQNKVKDCTYMTLLCEKVALHGAGELECPFVRFSVFNADRKLVEDPQDVAKHAYRNETCVWYAQQVHLQVPVETLPEGSFIVIELMDEKIKGKKIVSECVCWTFLRLKDGDIDTSSHSIECFQAPVNLGLGEEGKRGKPEVLETAICGGFVSVDMYLTSKRKEVIQKRMTKRMSAMAAGMPGGLAGAAKKFERMCSLEE